MNVKRILSVLLIMCMAFAVVGCNKKVDYNKVKWEGYDEAPFLEMLEKGVPDMLDPDDDTIEVDVSVKEGWEESDTLDEETLEDGCKAVTYEINASNDKQSVKFYFLMEYDKDSDALIAREAIVLQDGGGRKTYDVKDTEDALYELKDSMDSK
ncbi:MAG: hypothetical protein IKB50_01465 [Clostridia bacterium]|nr:hypothetical protein [Clostridia bacterium]